jgi:hypothetical protein
MLQTVDGREVFVVEFDTMPELPITWATPEEEPYALGLARAIEQGWIAEPGKYGVEVGTFPSGSIYTNIFKIEE